jgi:hypothetical protein
MLDAFSRVDAVEVPDIGRFELREKEARRCATVDGDPTIVARRRIVAFVAAQELKKALNSTVPATDVPRGLAARQQHPHLTRAHRPAEHRLKAMEFIGRGRRDFEPPKRYGDRHVLDAEADEVDIGEPL